MSTIAAIATPKGNGGIAVVRLSGPQSKLILAKSFLSYMPAFENFVPWRLHHGKILDKRNEPLDDVLAVYMPGPATFTGEDVAEVQCHGSYVIASAILENFIRLGARPAEAGEFTRRAFLNNRIDLTQAEAVAELVASPSREALRYSLNRLDGILGQKIKNLRDILEKIRIPVTVALDFPDDEIDVFQASDIIENTQYAINEIECLLSNHARSKTLQEGAHIVLAGPVNAGKSSLLNALCGKKRALVCDVPGTTRDYIEEWINIDGLSICLCDTAGLRDGEDTETMELLGMEKSRQLMERADGTIIVLDGERMTDPAGNPLLQNWDFSYLPHAVLEKPHLIVWNKCDLSVPKNIPRWIEEHMFCSVSCKTGENLDTLCKKLSKMLLADITPDANPLSPNERQALLLEDAKSGLTAFQDGLNSGETLDICVSHLESATESLGQIIGVNTTQELLDRIFSTFCIGK